MTKPSYGRYAVDLCSRLSSARTFPTFIQGLFCAFGILHIVDPDKAITLA